MMTPAAWSGLVALTLWSSLQDPSKAPVPPEADQAQSAKLIHEVFKEDYAKKGPADRILLAKKLLRQALETNDDPASCFVLLRESRELASAAGDSETALRAVAETARKYQGDYSGARAGVLTAASKTAKSPEEFQRLARSCLAWADEALQAEDVDGASRAAALAAQMARGGKDVQLVTRCEAKVRECADAKGIGDRLLKAREALRNGDDPAAHLTVGQYLCFVKEDWKQGLSHLAKGGDESLKSLAVRDLANPPSTAEQIAVGDGWWEVAEKQTGSAKERARRRAAVWYDRALAAAGGLQKLRLEKRLQEAGVDPSPGRNAVDLLKLIDPKRDALVGTWKLDDGGLIADGTSVQAHIKLEIPSELPEEYDLTAVVEKTDRDHVGDFFMVLSGGGRQFCFSVDAFNGTVGGIFQGDGKNPLESGLRTDGGFFTPGVTRTLQYSIRKDSFTVKADGKEYFAWKDSWSRLSLHGAFAGRGGRLVVGSLNCVYQIKKLTLAPAPK